MILFDWICLFVILFLSKIIKEMYLNGGTNDTTNETIEKLFKKNLNETTTTTSTTTTQLNTTLLLLSVCGRRLFPQSRVVGGEKSTFGKWPWQVSQN